MKNFKTSEKNRTNYIYYRADGSKIEIVPGENGVREIDIEILHSMDDEHVDKQRRYYYRVTTYLDAYFHMENGKNSDYNKYLTDNSENPDIIFLQQEEEKEYEHKLDKLRYAIKNLLPQQQELFKMKYIEERTNTDIALEENVTEAAIRNRLKKMQNKLKKPFA